MILGLNSCKKKQKNSPWVQIFFFIFPRKYLESVNVKQSLLLSQLMWLKRVSSFHKNQSLFYGTAFIVKGENWTFHRSWTSFIITNKLSVWVIFHLRLTCWFQSILISFYSSFTSVWCHSSSLQNQIVMEINFEKWISYLISKLVYFHEWLD